MPFDILNPIAFMLLAAVPFIVWVARRSYADLTRTRAKVLVVLRAAVMALVAVALAHVILTAKEGDLPVSTIFCVDVSDSISAQGKADAEAFIRDALEAKAPDDRAGIVAFGAGATVVTSVSTDIEATGVQRAAGGDTDIAAALRLAALSLPEGTEKRIVLLSDGNPTRGDLATRAAAGAARLGVRIDTRAPSAALAPDVAVAAVDLPAFVRKQQPFEVNVTLVSPARMTTTVKLYVDDMTEPAAEKPVILMAGSASVTFPVEISDNGISRIRVVTETENDARASNNAAEALVKVGPKPNVLLLAGKRADAIHLAEALHKQACDYRIFTPEEFDQAYARGPAGLTDKARRRRMAADVRRDFDVVIIANVPASNLIPKQIALINDLAAGAKRPADGDVQLLKVLHPIVKDNLSASGRKEISRMARLKAADLTAQDLALLRGIAGTLKKALPGILKTSLTYEQMVVLNRYVYRFGGGLVMVGGKDAFGAGGYYNTPIELALPVYTDPLKEAPVFAVVLIMDKSWSMGDPQMGDISKIDMIKESAIAALGKLTRKDHLAIISFDTEVHDIIAMSRVEDVEAKVNEISTMASFGLTNFYPALIKAQRILRATVADYKHAVLLSDGRPSGPSKDYVGQLAKMKKDRIVVSTIAIGVDADKKLMNNIAAWGNGQYYWTDKIKAIPEIILKEMGRLKELLLVEGKFKPRPGPRWHTPMLKDVSIKSMPEVGGFNRSRVKETAEVQLVVSAKDEPLLASWRYGSGRAIAFTSDAKNVWCPAWVKPQWRDGYARFWRQIVLGALQLQRSDSDYRMTLTRGPKRTRVVIDVADRMGRFLPGQRFTGRVSRVTDGKVTAPAEPVAFEPIAPGQYGATIAVDCGSPVLVEVTGGDGEDAFTDGAVALASDEHLNVGVNEDLLAEVRALTGGKVAVADEVFKRAGATTLKLRSLDVVLLAIATLLFAVDIFVRRMPALMQLFRGRAPAGSG